MALYTVEGQTLVIYHVLRVCFSLSCCALDILMDMLSVLYYTIFPSSHTFPPSSTIFLSMLSLPLHTQTFHLLLFPPSHLTHDRVPKGRGEMSKEQGVISLILRCYP